MKPFLTRLILITALIAMMLGGVTISHPQARSPKLGYASQAQRPHDPHSVLVKLAPGVDSPLERLPGARHLFDDWWRIPVSASKTAVETMNALTAREDVVTVELNYLVHLDDVGPVAMKASPQSAASYPNDPDYSRQWHLPQVQSNAAWDLNRGSGVIVAVVDSGVSRGDDLACRTFSSPYSAITNTPGEAAAQDQNGHGTHVAGTVGQCTNNSKGVAGMAPDVTLMPVRVLDADGNGSMADVANGLIWAADHGATVINLSLGMPCHGATWPSCSQSLVNDAITNAVSKDVLIVAAAGNSNGSTPYFPANHPQVMAVAAVDYTQQRTWYSNKGGALSVSAPGGDTSQDLNHDGDVDGILQQTFENNQWGYYFLQGTSMASPHVAGAAALLRSYVPGASWRQVRQALEQTAKDLGAPGKDNFYGYGLIQVTDALTYLKDHAGAEPPTPTGKTTYLPLILRRSPPPTPTPTPTNTPTLTPTPTSTPTPGLKDIYGRITYNNGPGAGIKLTLQKYNDSNETTVATTYADKNGRYSFKNAPTLPSGYKYYVRFGPNGDNNHYVYVWFGPDIASYHNGESVHGGDFDIADVKMSSPPSGATRSLPATFTWTKRVVTTDTYRWILFDVDTEDSWRTKDLGYAASVTITGLPDSVQRGKAYGWFPRPYHGSDSYGFPYYYRMITFSASANAVQDVETLIPMAEIGVQTKTAAHPLFEEK
jgi:serine protease